MRPFAVSPHPRLPVVGCAPRPLGAGGAPFALSLLIALLFAGMLCAARAAAPAWVTESGWRWHPVETGSSRPGGGFSRLPADATGVGFTNVLRGDLSLTNAVAHNGSGVALGDLDGDDLPELYFCALDGPNRLYRNLGNWRFEEVPAGAAACEGQRSTGAVFVDVDGDADLDLLVNGIAAGTRLFLNDGRGQLTERAGSGLSSTASSTSLALADIDGDGDLDLYCTHYIDVMHLADPTTRFALARENGAWRVTRVNGESTALPKWKDRFEAVGDGRVRELPEYHGFYRNEGGATFKAILFEPGVFRDAAGKSLAPFRDWGLSVMFRDLDGDGHPDLYVCNDNASPDRIWINRGDGTFRAADARMFRHTSRSSMGLDVADVDRDGHDDVLVLDMLARSAQRRLQQLVRESPDPATVENPDEVPRFNRNTFFFGRANGTYAEAALMAGVAATDWSWGAVFLDVDLDGYEDLLVTNGFEHDVMDQDSQDALRGRRLTPEQRKRVRQFQPSWHTPNIAMRNRRDGTFEPAPPSWGFDAEGISYGMALADLDLDGDLDVVVNELNAPAGIYRNECPGARVAVRLTGRAPNTAGIGARVTLEGGPVRQSQEIISGGRYLSGDAMARAFAAGSTTNAALTLRVKWRSGAQSELPVRAGTLVEVQEPAVRENRPQPAAKPPGAAPWFREWALRVGETNRGATGPDPDAVRQPLLPRPLGTGGPGVAWLDLDRDGWEDLIVPAIRGVAPVVYRNEMGRSFRGVPAVSNAPSAQSGWIPWVATPGTRSVLTAQYPAGDGDGAVATLSRWGLTDTGMGMQPLEQLTAGEAVVGAVAVGDVEGDGDLDVFAGGWYRPGRYPERVRSWLWRNDGGVLRRDEALSAPMATATRVTGAAFADLDGDGDQDLVVAQDWDSPRVYRNQGTQFEDVTSAVGLAGWTGWWSGVVVGDFDGDGRLDLAMGNRGRNTVAELHRPGPWRLYYGDAQSDGLLDLVESARDPGGVWRPTRPRSWLERGFADLPQRFATHAAFTRARAEQVFGAPTGAVAQVEATTLESMVFLNRGARFEAVPLPREAQESPVFGMAVADLDGDGLEDLFLGQNLFHGANDLSREDAGAGLWLRGQGEGRFAAAPTGVWLGGEQRGVAVADFDHDGRADLAIAQTQRPLVVLRNERARVGLRVQFAGPPGNPDAVGAVLGWVGRDGRRGPARAIGAGAACASWNGGAHLMALPEDGGSVWVRWPGGREQVTALMPGQREVSLRSP